MASIGQELAFVNGDCGAIWLNFAGFGQEGRGGSGSFPVVWVWSRDSGENRSPLQGVDSGLRRNEGEIAGRGFRLAPE